MEAVTDCVKSYVMVGMMELTNFKKMNRYISMLGALTEPESPPSVLSADVDDDAMRLRTMVFITAPCWQGWIDACGPETCGWVSIVTVRLA